MRIASAITAGLALGLAAPALAQKPNPCAAPEYRQLAFWVGDWDLNFDDGTGQTGTATNTPRSVSRLTVSW